ncbi:MAG: head GIN domain-containing protein [Catalinimonas sp.]
MKSVLLLALLLFSITLHPLAAQDRVVYTVDDYSKLDVGGVFDVYLRQGDTPSVAFEADEDILDNLKAEVQGGRLVLSMKGNPVRLRTLFKDVNVKAYVTFTELEAIELHGAADLRGESTVRGEALKIYVHGASDMRLEVDVRDLDVRISGAADVRLEGRTDVQRAHISGAADYYAYQLRSERTEVQVSGAADAKVQAREELDAQASGAAEVRYKGSPARTRLSGDVRRSD